MAAPRGSGNLWVQAANEGRADGRPPEGVPRGRRDHRPCSRSQPKFLKNVGHFWAGRKVGPPRRRGKSRPFCRCCAAYRRAARRGARSRFGAHPIASAATTGRRNGSRQPPARGCRNGLCAPCRMCRMVLSCRIGGSSSICAMANFLGRNSRRRRVLNEEALSASSAHLAMRDADLGTAGGARRYSDRAGVEHHPQVTDFLPRSYWALGTLAAVGAATTAAVEALF